MAHLAFPHQHKQCVSQNSTLYSEKCNFLVGVTGSTAFDLRPVTIYRRILSVELSLEPRVRVGNQELAYQQLDCR
jgi:hypothetical protein